MSSVLSVATRNIKQVEILQIDVISFLPLHMKKIAFYLLFVFFLCCGDPAEENVFIPENILPKEKIAQVITDIHIAEAEINLLAISDSTLKRSIYFKQIFDKHQITKQQYEESLAFYIDHPETLNKIYEQVLNDLSKMQAEMSK